MHWHPITTLQFAKSRFWHFLNKSGYCIGELWLIVSWKFYTDSTCLIFSLRFVFSQKHNVKKGVLSELIIRKWISKSFFSNQKDLFTRSSARFLGSLLPIRLHLLCTMCMKLGNTCLEFLVFIMNTCVSASLSLLLSLYLSLSHTHTHTHFVSYFLLFVCMQKRNEKKGESEKKYYESKTHVSGDWFMSVIWRHKHWGVITKISHKLHIYLSYLSLFYCFFNFCLWSKWQFCSAMSTS
jgi:hypothetical protein